MPQARWEDIRYNLNTGKIVTPANATPLALTSSDSDGKSKVNHIVKSIRCMPCVHQGFEHREKFGQSDVKFGKLFSRPVGRKKMMEDPDAKASMRNGWLGQHMQGVYDVSIVREYGDVVNEATRQRSSHGTSSRHLRRKELPVAEGKNWKKVQRSRRSTWESSEEPALGGRIFPRSRQLSSDIRSPLMSGLLWTHPRAECEVGRCHPSLHSSEAYTGPPCWVELLEDAWPARHRVYPEVQTTSSATCQST